MTNRGWPAHRPAAWLAGALGCALLTATACGVQDEQEPPASTTPITPSPTAEVADGPTTVRIEARGGEPVQVGSADVDVTVATLAGGEVTAAKAPEGVGALRFPTYRGQGRYPRAVVVVTNAGPDDALNPGQRPFTWGTDFNVATDSAGRAEDNGDNLVQRGLYSEPTLYKAELDLGRPACVVQGDLGTVTVRSEVTVIPGLWYHMECRREGMEVTVTTWPLADPSDMSERTVVGATGDVTPADPRVPMSIGGKVSANGVIVASATDQMNGDLATPFLVIGKG
ncbi:hypothetical protein E8D34_17840 [Nocardioides sp. GY 10113]|uniref:hypothetical protein n=1 Tax=Nocardioides sp. GY 10113 TaxID=2569761 RepID=UPI0010A83A91|nr:hypothetical protein [Nocardioides sp. GY 10113]TIC81544.1 hypothetical protein E8D34_17840 [Nocardioides sp. GY 10113]